MKTVEIFRTSVKTVKDADDMVLALLELYPIYKINFDLEDEEHILRVETERLEVETDRIIKCMIEFGYSCELLE